MLIWSFKEDGQMKFAYGNADGSPLLEGVDYFVFTVGQFGEWSYSPVEGKIFFHMVRITNLRPSLQN